jgi:membrane protein DedA with SNARE-associated domain
MNLTDQVLAALFVYGLPVLFGVILICSLGIPFPISLLLVVVGSLAEQGDMKLWQVIAVASVAAVLGDQVAYGLARWAGRRLVNRIGRKFGAEKKVKQAEDFTQRWGSAGVFFSRWLVTALGPWVNIASGIAAYPWKRFLLWDVLGQVLWVVVYVSIGYVFSNRVQAVRDVLGNLTWVILGLVGTVILGWQLFFRSRSAAKEA